MSFRVDPALCGWGHCSCLILSSAASPGSVPCSLIVGLYQQLPSLGSPGLGITQGCCCWDRLVLGHWAQRRWGGWQGTERWRSCSQDIRDAAVLRKMCCWHRSGLWEPDRGKSWRRRAWGCVAARGAGTEMPDFWWSSCR